MAWPAVTEPAAAQFLALLYQLEQSQWWPPERLLEQQLKQAYLLLQHAFHTVPWQRERLAAAGFDENAALDPDSFCRLPLMTRRDLQCAGNNAFSTAVPRGHGAVQTRKTTGSTGRPLVFRQTGLNYLLWRTVTLRDHFWHQRDLSTTLAAIRSGAPNGVQASWGVTPCELYSTGPCATLNIQADIATQAAWVFDTNPTYLLTMPSNLSPLLAAIAGARSRLTRLRQCITVGEILPPGLRQECRERLGVPLIDIYSAREVGYLALQCPQRECYHVQSETVLLEVLDETGAPCQTGQMGRVVVTVLHSFAMPLVRYDIGDFAIVGDRCACGRGLPVLERIIGRSRNLVTLPDGTRHWPTFGKDKWVGIFPIEQAQFVQSTQSVIEARLVATRSLSTAEEKDFCDILRESLGYPFDISISYRREIPRGPGDKFEEFVSKLTAAEAASVSDR